MLGIEPTKRDSAPGVFPSPFFNYESPYETFDVEAFDNDTRTSVSITGIEIGSMTLDEPNKQRGNDRKYERSLTHYQVISSDTRIHCLPFALVTSGYLGDCRHEDVQNTFVRIEFVSEIADIEVMRLFTNDEFKVKSISNLIESCNSNQKSLLDDLKGRFIWWFD